MNLESCVLNKCQLERTSGNGAWTLRAGQGCEGKTGRHDIQRSIHCVMVLVIVPAVKLSGPVFQLCFATGFIQNVLRRLGSYETKKTDDLQLDFVKVTL